MELMSRCVHMIENYIWIGKGLKGDSEGSVG